MTPLPRTLLTVALAVGMVLGSAGCVDARDVDPAAKPDEAELNRLQETVNARPDLETVQAELRALRAQVQHAINRIEPGMVLPDVPTDDPGQPPPGRLQACLEPFNHTVGRRYRSGEFVTAGGGFDLAQWEQLVADMTPVFDAAGFSYDSERYGPPGSDHRNASQVRDDGVRIEFLGSVHENGPVLFGYDIACNLPAAWRTGPLPADEYATIAPGAHYPYLYGDGREDS
jgi:hypothetical protein